MAEEIVSIDTKKNRSEIASTLRTIADQLDGGDTIDLDIDDQSAVLAVVDEMEFELEIERENDGKEIELEIEIEWEDPGEAAAGDENAAEVDSAEVDDDTESVPSTVDDDEREMASQGEFQLFKDRADEWRWRLVHRNGNIIATSGEGYTTKRNANKGLTSLLKNAPGAEVTEVDESS